MLANGIVLALVLGYAVWAVRRLLRRRAKPGGCCGGCAGCQGCQKARSHNK